MRPLLIALILLPAAARADWLVLLDTTDRHGHLEAKGDHGGAALLAGYLANARKAVPGRVLAARLRRPVSRAPWSPTAWAKGTRWCAP